VDFKKKQIINKNILKIDRNNSRITKNKVFINKTNKA